MERTLNKEFYLMGCYFIEFFLFCSIVLLGAKDTAGWVATPFCLFRIIDVVQVAANVVLFDHLGVLKSSTWRRPK